MLPELVVAVAAYVSSYGTILVVGLDGVQVNFVTSFTYLLDTVLMFKIDYPPFPSELLLNSLGP